jgi:hypothetical protein
VLAPYREVIAALQSPAAEQSRIKAAAVQQAARARGGGVGRRGHPDSYYKAIAEDAVLLANEGHPIRESLAGKYGVSSDAIRDAMQRARDLGYLAPQAPGHRGALPGPRLLAEATEHNEEGDEK